MEQPERIWAQSSDNTTRFGTWDDHRPHSDCVEYIRKDLAVLIPPEGPERDALIGRMVKAICGNEGCECEFCYDLEAWYPEARAALAVLIGDD